MSKEPLPTHDGEPLFKTRLKELLDEKGMKQADLCRATGFESGKISQYITGKSTPNIDTAKIIARTLGVTLDELVGWKPSQKTETPKQKIECTADEIEIIRKFRGIDKRGQRTVMRLLNAEYEDAIAGTNDQPPDSG